MAQRQGSISRIPSSIECLKILNADPLPKTSHESGLHAEQARARNARYKCEYHTWRIQKAIGHVFYAGKVPGTKQPMYKNPTREKLLQLENGVNVELVSDLRSSDFFANRSARWRSLK